MNTNIFTRYYHFILTGLLLGVLASAFAVYAEQTGEPTPLVVEEESTAPVEESIITAEPEIIASATNFVTEEATTTETLASSTEDTSTTTSTMGGEDLAAVAEASFAEDHITTSQTETMMLPPREPDLVIISDSSPVATEPTILIEELSEPALTPEECHTIFRQHGFRNPGECMRLRIHS